MKKYFLILLAIPLFLSSCMPSPDEGENIEISIQKIIEVNKSKNEIFISSVDWIAKTFKSAKSVIDIQDKDAGKIIAKGNLKNNDFMGSTTHFTINIDIKEGKARASIENIYTTAFFMGQHVENYRTHVRNEKELIEVHKKFDPILESYENHIKSKKESW